MDEIQTNETRRTDPRPPFHYGGFWMRFWAYLLDLAVIGGVSGILVKPLFRALDLQLSASGIFTPINIASALIFYLYFVLMTKFFRQTLGKMVFGLKVIPLNDDKLSWSTVLFREWIGRYISATIWILYIIAAFTPKKQALHDMFADTAVVHERRETAEPAYS
ncbi:MAG TPA: RDD family protein [Bacillus bacterium]|uniref:Membrane protein YteJ n=1 Tax=Siminovitchia fordii TaxID=254759 RepID=A0ABQ4KDH3_9BACI|nr:RDD family protein [Siminovitchia fordii]GIN23250.1 putative membrane protein YteJ [Siminovitchia fordii]HBZ09670.1 RDD family protein [Bacillus sp. (in: firmicutes)]